jgi:hypothetical protein
MRAKFVNEKFEEHSDPVHDMGIGDPLLIAASKLQKFAESKGYHFEMKKISGVESPIIIVDLPEPYFKFWDGYMKPGACYVKSIKYTLTYMPHQAPRIFSLRKVWIGYKSDKKDKYFQDLRFYIRNGNVKEIGLEQQLMGRFTKHEIYIIIDKIEKSIKKELRKTE